MILSCSEQKITLYIINHQCHGKTKYYPYRIAYKSIIESNNIAKLYMFTK